MRIFKNFTKFATLTLLSIFVLSVAAHAQDRERVVEKKTKTSKKTPTGLRNPIVVRNGKTIKKTSSSRAANAPAARTAYMSATRRSMMMDSISRKLGIRYRYGTQGPRTYDCSGFVWKVFNEAGIPLTRTSARVYWKTYEPVKGDERFEFGTLVFFNRLGHMGIVAGKDGFYHASSSKGVTYSKFKGYWSKRIVGYRRVPLEAPLWSDIVDEEDQQVEDRKTKVISN